MANLSRKPPESPLDPRGVRRALVIRPRFVGDLCLTLPVVDHLRRHAPQAEVDYLTDAAYAPLLAGDPRLARVLSARRGAAPGAAAALFSALARAGYDLVLDLFCNPRTALWTAATGARVRVGYAGKGWRSSVYNRFPRHAGKSAVRFHLASIDTLGWETDPAAVPDLRIPDAEARAARGAVARFGVEAGDGARLVAIHPGARWPTRQWPPERYAALARQLLERRAECRALILAGPGEEPLAEQIVRAVDHPRCAAVGGLTLRELAALLAACAAFVGPDSGPVHVAVAAGTPSVGIFGRNEPERFFPYPARRGHRAVYAGVWCSPCHLDVCPHTSCLAAVTAERVWSALAEILERDTPWPAAAAAAGGAA
jgi:lipopolysaccharide heptosyltransferase II